MTWEESMKSWAADSGSTRSPEAMFGDDRWYGTISGVLALETFLLHDSSTYYSAVDLHCSLFFFSA